jgi:arogenate dehydrogenase (NADP+)
VVTPSEDLEALEKVRSLWQAVGMNIHECSPEEHDRAVAMISHAPVMISASLIAACQREDEQTVLKLAQSLASSGFRDTSRVGGGNPELGRLMAEYNQSAVLRSLYTYQQSLQEIIDLIEAKQWDNLEAFLANTQRDRPFYVD